MNDARDTNHVTANEKARTWLQSLNVPPEAHSDLNWRDPNGYSPLHIACRHGHRNACTYLLLLGHSLEAEVDKHLKATPFGVAILYKRLDLCKWLVDESRNFGFDARTGGVSLGVARNSIGITPLMFACMTDSLEMVKWALSIAPPNDLYTRDALGRSALMFAAANASVPVLRWVMSQVTDREIAAIDHRGLSLAHYAAENHIHVVLPYIFRSARCRTLEIWKRAPEILLNAIATECVRVLNYVKDTYGGHWILDARIHGIHPVLAAAALGKVTILEWFVRKWPKILDETNDKNGGNAFIFASVGGRVPVLKWLVEIRGVNPTEQRYRNGGAANAAAEGGHKAVFEWLISIKCPLVLTGSKYDAIDIAVEFGHLALVRWLYETHETLLPLLDSKAELLCRSAARRGEIDMMKWLYDKSCFKTEYAPMAACAAIGSDDRVDVVIWLIDKFGIANVYKDVGWRPLFEYAAESQCEKIMKLWLAEGCLTPGERFRQPLFAATDGNIMALKLLNTHGISLKSRTRGGQSLLMLAAGGGHLECVQWLLKRGCSLMDKDHDGLTALDIAAYNNHDAVVDFLRPLMYPRAE